MEESKLQLFDSLKKSVFEYNGTGIRSLITTSIEHGINPLEVIELLTSSMSLIGERFEKGELFLPDLMLAAKTMQNAMMLLENEIMMKGVQRKFLGRIVIGTVYGDIHDIGKNIVATLMAANGFEVIDLGVNVKSDQFVQAVKKHNPNILALSALLTTTAPEQQNIISTLERSGIRKKIKIMVGGGSITKEFAVRIGADGYEPTAPLAVKLAKQFMNLE